MNVLHLSGRPRQGVCLLKVETLHLFLQSGVELVTLAIKKFQTIVLKRIVGSETITPPAAPRCLIRKETPGVETIPKR